MERDEIPALAHHNPDVLVKFIRNPEETVKQLQDLCSGPEVRIAQPAAIQGAFGKETFLSSVSYRYC